MQWHAHDESAAVIRGGIKGNASAHYRKKIPGQRETQAGALLDSRVGSPGLAKPLEQHGPVLQWDSRPGVAYPKFEA